MQHSGEFGDFTEAAGLLDYDPVKFARIYRGHPLRLLKRLWQTLLPIGIFLFNLVIDKVLGLLKNSNRAKKKAKEFVYRVHDLPDNEKIESLGSIVKRLGYSINNKSPKIAPKILKL